MPYTFHVDPSSRLAWVSGSGPMDLEESLAAPASLMAHPDYQPGFAIVVDLRELDYEPAATDVVAVARNLVRMRPLFTSRMAVIVRGSHSLAAELVAAIASAGGLSLRIFSDEEEARLWATDTDASPEAP